MTSTKQPLPARITIALVLVLITVAWNIVRVSAGISMAAILWKYAPWPGPLYIAVTGAVFATTGLVLLWAFWARRGWAPMATLVAGAVHAAWYWGDLLVLQHSVNSRWRWSLLITLPALAYLAALAFDPRSRRYLGREAHEHKEQDRPAS